MNTASSATTSAPARSRTKVANASSNSRSLLAFNMMRL
jgi:hypothetical protein